MRELNKMELDFVSGGHGVCTPNNLGGITDSAGSDRDFINIYEGLVAFTSHVIERVANAL